MLRGSKKQLVFICLAGSILIVCLAWIAFSRHKAPATSVIETIVPSSITQKTSFPIYYPDPQKLPSGYNLDRNSFDSTGEIVIFSVNYASNKKIAFTLQKKPSNDQLDIFYANQLPLRTDLDTPLGAAAIGTLNNQKFLSLPIKTDVWLIATAPLDLDAAVLTEIAKNIIQ